MFPCRLSRSIEVRYWVCNQPHSFDPVTAGTMLLELTQVTRDHLRGVGSLWALWATAQQINARQKVELSIRCVSSTINVQRNYDTPSLLAKASRASLFVISNFNLISLTVSIEYWRDLGESVFFQGHPLVDCIERIHDDILKVWNFNDPLKVSAYLTSWETEIHVHSSATFRRAILERDDWTCRTFV